MGAKRPAAMEYHLQSNVWGAISRAVRTPSRVDRDIAEPNSPPTILIGGSNFVSETLMPMNWVSRSIESKGVRVSFNFL